MTKAQASIVRELRIQGTGYRSIASAVGLSRDIVRNYCKTNGLDGYAKTLVLNLKERVGKDLVCSFCGKEIIQSAIGRPKKFCSDKCRREWWREHPEATTKKDTAVYKKTCPYCEKVFESYGNSRQKYCSHHCYIKDRFWRDELNGV